LLSTTETYRDHWQTFETISCTVAYYQLDSHDCEWLDDAFDAELLRDDHGGLLPDDERRPVSVRADICWRDRQVRNFEPAYAIYVQLCVYNAAFLARLHRTGA
jgi:hypothetical protein